MLMNKQNFLLELLYKFFNDSIATKTWPSNDFKE